MTNLANELRANIAAILAKYTGPHEAVTSMRLSTVKQIAAIMDEQSERLSMCTCEPGGGFEIDVTRETPAYAALRRASIDRMLGV